MPAGTASALAVVRVPHGQPRPPEPDLRAALDRDRVRLHLSTEQHGRDVAVAGPYVITVDGQQLDEYVVWER